MKKCSRCGEEVPVENFRKSSRAKDGLHAWCTPCFAKYERERYQSGDRARKDANKRLLEARGKAYVKEYLLDHPCVDCGEADIVVLDFDHQGDKLYNIADIYHRSLPTIETEISKCQVRCSNCHRRRTAKTRGSWRL